MSARDCQFSVSIEMSASQHIWLVSLHEACKILGDVCGVPTDEFLAHARGVLGEPASEVGYLSFNHSSGRTFLDSFDNGNVDYTADLLQAFLKNFDRTDIIHLEWSENKKVFGLGPVTGGGGAMVISKDRRLAETTGETCRKLEEKLLALIAKD